MQHRIAALAATVALATAALTGCGATEAPSVAVTPGTGPLAPVAADAPGTATQPTDEGTLDGLIESILAQEAATMTSNDVLNAAQKLRTLAGEEYSNAALGSIRTELLKITLDCLDIPGSDPAPALQARLVEYAKQVRELP